MKIIDAHAHIGYIGGWANVGITEEGLISQMESFSIVKTALCCEDNDVTMAVITHHPGKIIGCVYVDPGTNDAIDIMERYASAGFFRSKAQSAETRLLR